MNDTNPDDYLPPPSVPAALTVVAWLFILSGVSTIVQVVVDLVHNRLTLTAGVLGVLIGPGLLRFSQGWRTCALVMLWIGMILSPVILVFMLSARGLATIDLFGVHVGRVPAAIGVLFGAAMFALTVWEYRVLVREDIRALFGLPPRS